MTKDELDAIFGHSSNIANGVAQTIDAAHDVFNTFTGGNTDSRRNFGPMNPGLNQPAPSVVSYGYGYADNGSNGMGNTFGMNNNSSGYPGISHPSWGMANGGGMF